MIVRLTPEARADIAEARLWYRKRETTLDAAFLDEVERCVRSIGDHPERGSLVEGRIRRILMRRFPYGVYYALFPNEAVVIACLHGARSPVAWRRTQRG